MLTPDRDTANFAHIDLKPLSLHSLFLICRLKYVTKDVLASFMVQRLERDVSFLRVSRLGGRVASAMSLQLLM